MLAKPTHQFVRVDFNRFKAFKTYSIELKHFNVLVGPNNAGKSTVLTAFRILAAAMRKASRLKAESVRGPQGRTLGHSIDIRAISVAEENIFHNYDDGEAASVTFHLSNKNTLTLYFPALGTCFLLMDAHGKSVSSPTTFRSNFNCPIGFVPILGPVEHHEQVFEKEAARLALFSYGAARNFRNIWYHYPEKFAEFRAVLRQTWPGMDIEPPELDISHTKPRLHMYCPENRIPREIFWAGFGFQVWCQMLTHLIQSSDKALFLIDEPDIYLHSELQRQLLGLLRNLGPDILIATHSTEIITEAETDDIVLVTKGRRRARRMRDTTQLEEVFKALGSNINPILTQLAKTRRALFVEGKDFQILGKFARKMGFAAIGNRADFAVVPVGGFNPERIRTLKLGMEATLGRPIVTSAIFDRDYRSEAECASIAEECSQFCDFVSILKRKEIENYLLVPAAIDRAAEQRVLDKVRRSGLPQTYLNQAQALLGDFANAKKTYVASQIQANLRQFERKNSPSLNDTAIIQTAIETFDRLWADETARFFTIPGKDALSAINGGLQEQFGVSVTPTAIIDAMHIGDIPAELRELIQTLAAFVAKAPQRSA